MTVSVRLLLVTYNSEKVLPDFLSSLPEGLAGITEWSLHVADNASSDDGVTLIKEAYPKAHIHELLDNRGYAAGINAALKSVEDAAHVLVLNPDVRLRPGCVAELLEALEQGVGLVAPRMVDEHQALVYSLWRKPTILRALGEAVLGGARAGRYPLLGENIRSASAYLGEGTADWTTGAALLITPECRRAVGLWDETFFLYSEETDYCLRAADAGYRLKFLGGVTVTHLGGESTTSSYLWSILQYNRIRLYRKRHSAPATAAFYLVVLMNAGVRAARGSQRDRAALRVLLRPSARPDVVRTSNQG